MILINQEHTFSSLLLEWYDANRRILPWREEPTPYHVWLSEIMLQQTRVEAVRNYYLRFLDTLPDIPSLAAASEDAYMKLWEGLGYYSRVRNLHKGAVQVMEIYGGEMPPSYEKLLKITGIGPYTAAAIASIAFGQKIPSVDGNLMRVFARLTEYPDPVRTDKAIKEAFSFFIHKMPENRPGDFNQALMDLGALVCVPYVPVCLTCPLTSFCRAWQEEKEQDYPVPQAKKPRPAEQRTVFLILYGDSAAVRKRPEKGLLAGLYEFPNVSGHLSENEAAEYVRSLGFVPETIEALPPARHIFTHKEWDMTGFAVRVTEKGPGRSFPDNVEYSDAPSVFLCEQREIETKYAIPSAFRTYKDCLERMCGKSRCKKGIKNDRYMR